MLNPNEIVRAKSGWRKVIEFTRISCRKGYDFAWIDTCCIDKTSSAELSEAINSMFAWYHRSGVCIVFLEDVKVLQGVQSIYFKYQCEHSRWFTRGWTLQELVASKVARFYNGDWHHIELAYELLEAITRIPYRVLRRGLTDDVSVAQKMSWASRRHTTREEDIAYCLMGLFDVNMPLLYGEGAKAFGRLQEEIIRRSNDHTIFLWQDRHSHDTALRGFLARHPSEFDEYKDIQGSIQARNTVGNTVAPYTLTNIGLQMSLTLFQLKSAPIGTKSYGARENLLQLSNPGELFVPLLHGHREYIEEYPTIVLPLDGPALAEQTNAKFKLSRVPRLQQIYILAAVRLTDLPKDYPVSGFCFVPEDRTGNLDCIGMEDDCNGLGAWEGEGVKNLIPGSCTAVIRLSPVPPAESDLFGGANYMQFRQERTGLFVSVNPWPPRGDVAEREHLYSTVRRGGESKVVFKDRLLVQVPISHDTIKCVVTISKVF